MLQAVCELYRVSHGGASVVSGLSGILSVGMHGHWGRMRDIYMLECYTDQV